MVIPERKNCIKCPLAVLLSFSFDVISVNVTYAYEDINIELDFQRTMAPF
jgi:hypothetical protein